MPPSEREATPPLVVQLEATSRKLEAESVSSGLQYRNLLFSDIDSVSGS